MRTVLGTLATLAALGVAAGSAVIFLGLYNVSARAGHWAITSWLLHTTYRNAVELRARPESDVPELTEDLVRLGARHFEGACQECHATPAEERVATMQAMLPAPPHIQDAVNGWRPNELGWIVYNGVKMSGMPPWPADREDEVWSVVAFLEQVQSMDAEAYLALTAPPPVPANAPAGLAYCAGCHGLNGRSGNPHIPRLDLQSAAYLSQSLASYLDGTRESGIMSHAATEVRGEALPALAAYFAALPPAPVAQPMNPDLASIGEALASSAGDDPEVPACLACHGPDPRGVPDSPEGPGPALAGQYEAYLAAQLRLWREGNRGGGPRAELMARAAEHLTDDAIVALSAYYAGLVPEPGR